MREISDWLGKKHNVTLSPAAISRALSQPNLHLERLAGFVSARARFLALVVNSTPRDLLRWPDDGPSELEILIVTRQSPTSDDDINILADAEELLEMWRSIPHEVRLLLEPRLAFETDHEPNDDPYAQFDPEEDED